MTRSTRNQILTPEMVQYMKDCASEIWSTSKHRRGSDRNWQIGVNLYTKIQSLCDRPAYFWYNYKITEFPSTGVVMMDGASMSISEAVDTSWGSALMVELEMGLINPQAFCDARV